MADEAVTAAQAELDQAKAALKAAQKAYDPVFAETVKLDTAKLKALAEYKEKGNEIGGRLAPLSAALEAADADVRRAEARLTALQNAGSYTEPPAQGIGGE